MRTGLGKRGSQRASDGEDEGGPDGKLSAPSDGEGEVERWGLRALATWYGQNDLPESLLLDRLDEVNVKSGVFDPLAILCATVSRDGDERGVSRRLVRAKSLGELTSIHARQSDVDQRYIGVGLYCDIESTRSVSRLIDAVTIHFQVDSEHVAYVRIVLDNNNAMPRGACRTRPVDRGLVG